MSNARLQEALAAVAAEPSVDNHHRAAAAYLALGIRDQAFDHFAAALAIDRADAAAHDALARIWRDWGWLEPALAAAHRAVHFAPRAAEPRNTLGIVLEALGEVDEAREAFATAVVLDPRAWWAWTNLCALELAEGRLDEAAGHCRAAAAIDGGDGRTGALLEEIARRRHGREDSKAPPTR